MASLLYSEENAPANEADKAKDGAAPKLTDAAAQPVPKETPIRAPDKRMSISTRKDANGNRVPYLRVSGGHAPFEECTEMDDKSHETQIATRMEFAFSTVASKLDTAADRFDLVLDGVNNILVEMKGLADSQLKERYKEMKKKLHEYHATLTDQQIKIDDLVWNNKQLLKAKDSEIKRLLKKVSLLKARNKEQGRQLRAAIAKVDAIAKEKGIVSDGVSDAFMREQALVRKYKGAYENLHAQLTDLGHAPNSQYITDKEATDKEARSGESKRAGLSSRGNKQRYANVKSSGYSHQ